jgi:translocator protein
MKIKKLDLLLGSILICLAAGWLGSVFTSPSIATWYAELNKPAFNPPNYLFGPVWSLLYILMGISLYLIIRNNFKDKSKRVALILFGGQLLFNIFWSFIFFYLHRPDYAFIEIVILWILILATAVESYRINKAAGYLFIPYLLWVSFASALNFAIWQLN